MLNAEDIISLEKKWFTYKFKSKIKFLFIIILIFLFILSGKFVYFYINKVSKNTKSKYPQKTELIQHSDPLHVKQAEKDNAQKKATVHEPIIVLQKIEENTTNASILPKEKVDNNLTNTVPTTIEKEKPKEVIIENRPSYYLKIEPTLKNNELFSSSGALHFNPPFTHKPKDEPLQKSTQIKENNNKNNAISISSSEIDTITYLKDKFSSTKNVVFAIMLSEELYNMSKYKQSIQWALTANELDPTNEKSWYWFAKNKVKLNHKEDAIKALETFLSNNNSSRLKTLLKEIKDGE